MIASGNEKVTVPNESLQPSQPVRSAEKSRKATCAFADSIAAASIDLFNALKRHPSISVEYKQSVLSTICARLDWGKLGNDPELAATPRDVRSDDNTRRSSCEPTLEIVSLGCGTKYLASDMIGDLSSQRGSQQTGPQLISYCVKDMHGEIIAMRAFRLFLAFEAIVALEYEAQSRTRMSDGDRIPQQKSANAEPSRIFTFDSEKKIVRLRDGVSFHMYTSSQPCGNASVKKWAAGGIGPTFPELSPTTVPYPIGIPQEFSFESRKDEDHSDQSVKNTTSRPNELVHAPILTAPAPFGSVAVLYKRPRYATNQEKGNINDFYQAGNAPSSESTEGLHAIVKTGVRVVESESSSLRYVSRLPQFDSTELPPSCVPIPRVQKEPNSENSEDVSVKNKEIPSWKPATAVVLEHDKLLTCSDKIMQRNVLGYQGKNLASLVGRIHVSTLVVGRKFTAKTAERAVCCRVAGVKGVAVAENTAAAPSTNERSNGGKWKGKSCEVYLPFGTKHMACVSSCVKLDDSVYTCPQPKVADAKIHRDEPLPEGETTESDHKTGADFSDSRCIAWVRTSVADGKMYSFHTADPIEGGLAVVLDGSTGLRFDPVHNSSINNQNACEALESFISPKALKTAASAAQRCFDTLVCANSQTQARAVHRLPEGTSTPEVLVSCLVCDRLENGKKAPSEVCRYHYSKKQLRSRSLPFMWA